MWKPLPSIRVLKTLRGSLKGKVQGKQYLLAVGLDGYKWYQSQTLGDVLARRLSLNEGWRRGDVPAWTLGPKVGGLGGSTLIGEENKCQRGRWAPKEVDCEIPHRLGEERNNLYKIVETSP